MLFGRRPANILADSHYSSTQIISWPISWICSEDMDESALLGSDIVDCRLSSQLSICPSSGSRAGTLVFRRAGTPVFRREGMPVFRRTGTPAFREILCRLRDFGECGAWFSIPEEAFFSAMVKALEDVLGITSNRSDLGFTGRDILVEIYDSRLLMDWKVDVDGWCYSRGTKEELLKEGERKYIVFAWCPSSILFVCLILPWITTHDPNFVMNVWIVSILMPDSTILMPDSRRQREDPLCEHAKTQLAEKVRTGLRFRHTPQTPL